MNRPLLVPAVLLVLLVGVPAVSTAAAPLDVDPITCHDLEVTLTGTPGGTVVGTSGADVIDTAGARFVRALAGDDTICVTGESTGRGEVDAGAGDDVVDTTAVTGRSRAILGRGDDTFVGGDGADEVRAQRRPAAWDTGTDSVRTGAGPDRVYLARGSDGYVDGGAGSDTLGVLTPGRDGVQRGAVRVDLVAGTVSSGSSGAVAHVISFNDVVVGSPLTVTVIGSRTDNDIVVHGCRVAVAAGAGADEVSASWGRDECQDVAGRGLTARGGPGADTLRGFYGADTLIGGRGYDLAVGGEGRDTCRTELRDSCEAT